MRSLFILLCLLSLGCGRTDQPTSQITSQVLLHPHIPEHVNHTVHFGEIPKWLQEQIWEDEEQLITDLLSLERTESAEIDRIIDEIVTIRQQIETYRVFLLVDGMALIGSNFLGNVWLENMANIMLTMTSKRPEIRKELHWNTGFYFAIFHPGRYAINQIPEWREFKRKLGNRLIIGIGGFCLQSKYYMCVAPSFVWENSLSHQGFRPENSWRIAIHEFAHAIDFAIRKIDPSFQDKLQQAYENAKENKLWTYLTLDKPDSYRDNAQEYWAEGVEAWFIGKEDSFVKNAPFLDRESLLQFDPKLYELLNEWLPQEDIPLYLDKW